ncbi:leucyl/phenylalanyl-tRNA--protein transferase [Novosphingobium lentum]|uniref:leucyl/phenylalanyl-tRNA--protein transferase n=1 Tax=Novosphingobium lentum TaxID=145287 RepID=UPI000836ACBE|nr:leucyl/phenylalanyl-tRNA--protein transferase [Novosphingobium lentum]
MTVTSPPNRPAIIPPDLLLKAYRAGIFPMADSREDPDVYWVEPKQRAILPLDGFHCSHSLARTLRRERFRVTCNAAFDSVIDACAAPRAEAEDSWISTRIRDSYRTLNRLGQAHSIECWQGEVLVGGLYGVGFSRVFCGESMFSLLPDSSKVALAWLVAALRRAGARLLDCQFITPHLASMGAVEIPQARYLALLDQAQHAGLAQRDEPGQRTGAGGTAAAGVGAAVGVVAGAGVLGRAAEGAAADLPEGFAALLDDALASSSSPGNFIAQSFTHTS